MSGLMRAGGFALAAILSFAPFWTFANAQPAVLPGTVLLNPRDPADGQWHWLSVEAARGSRIGWVTTSGTATLKMEGRHFHAYLTLDESEAGADLSLDGTIAGNQIRATELLLNTDASPAAISGSVRRTIFGDAVETRIVFHGGQSGDASFLGIYRLTSRKTDGR